MSLMLLTKIRFSIVDNFNYEDKMEIFISKNIRRTMLFNRTRGMLEY